MGPTIKSSASGGGFEDLKATLSKLAKANVYVGIPEDKNARKEPGANNATLLYFFTHGSALAGTPARPVIEPAIEDKGNSALITRELANGARGLMQGNATGAAEALNKAGVLASNAAKRWFVDPRNGWAPNADSTAERKGSDRPGIDTGQMRRAITYSVEE